MRSVPSYTQPFETRVDAWVKQALDRGARDLDALLSKLPSVYPAEILESAKRLRASGDCGAAGASNVLESAQRNTNRASRSPELVVPHPLDFDWRFTPASAEALAVLAGSFGSRLVCLGAPSVFAAALRSRFLHDVTLVDKNASLYRNLPATSEQLISCNLLTDGIPNTPSDVLVLDPPWYLEHYRAFLWVASQLCGIGSHVFVSLPPEGTRPNIEHDISSILEWTRQLGFDAKYVDHDILRYQTPPFERNALHAAGVTLRSTDWRSGVLCILQRTRNLSQPRPPYNPANHCEWDEWSLGGARFFIRRRNTRHGANPTLIPLVAGDILPSVSRRHRLRSLVDVWTSGNRIFRCQSTSILSLIAESLSMGVPTLPYVLGKIRLRPTLRLLLLVDRAARTLQDLASKESVERR